jgi:hypothetical protein
MAEPSETKNIGLPDTRDDGAFGDLPELRRSGTRALEAWFLGPKAENAQELEALLLEALRDHVYWRRNFHPGDPTHITEKAKREPDFLLAQDRLKENFRLLLAALKKSVPFFSMRYQGHMDWDLTIPGIVGYFAAMLYNPNNVAFEGSTATTILEMRVAEDICNMLGYKVPSKQEQREGAIPPWGHLTCDGTVANIEALWSARNVKFYPLAIQRAVQELDDKGLDLDVTLCDGTTTKKLGQLEPWELLNIRCDDTLKLPERLHAQFQIPIDALTQAAKKFAVQEIGMHEFGKEFLGALQNPPVVLVSGTKHYSLPKAMALLGLGASNLKNVPVDEDARMNAGKLKDLLLEYSKNKTPVLAVVSVMGSTEESAVDPLVSILRLRDEFRSQGLDFNVHADAAWGGYHVCTIREDGEVGAELPTVESEDAASAEEDQPPPYHSAATSKNS